MLKSSSVFQGSGLLELKSQLQRRMKVVREVNRKEAEVRHKLENEDFDEEDEEWEDEDDAEEDGSDDDDVIEDNNKQMNSKNVKKSQGIIIFKGDSFGALERRIVSSNYLLTILATHT